MIPSNHVVTREAALPRTRCRCVALLVRSARRPEEVIGATQMEQVRENMKRAADAVLKSKGKVVNVWPNDWILE